MNLDYNQSVKLLTSQGKFRISLGLERMRAVLELLGNPQDKLKIIHAAGTNGKGSVCAICANILKSAGYKTGLYTSPHLLEYTERIRINNIEISRNDFAYYVSLVCETAEKNNIDLTEFEILTACAYKYFADNNIDIAVIETGLGGRFDATNAVDKDLVSVITSISLDHMDRLGNTIEKIAFEKAGIIKKNSNVIISKENAGYYIVKQTAEKIHAKIIDAENEISVENNYALINGEKYEFALIGTYQKQNLALALRVIDYLKENGFIITKSALKEGLATVKWAARLEYIKKYNLIADGAHNPDGANELKKSLETYYADWKKVYIYGTINTKDYKKTAEILFNENDEIYYYEFEHKNAVSYNEYTRNVNWLHNVKLLNRADIPELLRSGRLKVLTGSLYMIGEFYKKYIFSHTSV